MNEVVRQRSALALYSPMQAQPKGAQPKLATTGGAATAEAPVCHAHRRRGAISMLRLTLCSGPLLALGFCASGPSAAGFGVPSPTGDAATSVLRVHSVYEAEDSLHRRGYYDVRLERASLPYSFNASKRGGRYHIHFHPYRD